MKEGYKRSELGEIPVEWEVVKLGNITKSYAGGTPLRNKPEYYVSGTIPWVKSGEVNQRVIYDTEEKITETAIRESAARIIKPNSILVALYGATAGNIGKLMVQASSNQAVLAVNSISLNLINDYIYHYLKLSTQQLLTLTQGSGQPNLSKSLIDGLSILLPPLPEQQKIAAILSTVDEKIELIEGRIAQTQALKKGLMQKLLTEGIGHSRFKDSALGRIPEGWEVVKLGDLVTKVGSGITPRGGSESYLSEGVTFIRSQNVLVNKLVLDDVAFISSAQHDKMSNSKLEQMDVLLNITGASIGRCCLVPKNFKEGNVNQHVCIIRTLEILSPVYLGQLLNSTLGWKQVDKFQAGGNREGLNFQQIRSFDIPLPSPEEQSRICDILTSIDEKLEILESKKQHFQELKKGLMQQLLTGRVRVG